MQFLIRVLVSTSSLLGALWTTSTILVLHIQHSEPQENLPTSSLKAWYFLLPRLTQTVCMRQGQSQCWQPGTPAHIFCSCGRAFSCSGCWGTCANCPERCPWLGAGWKESWICFLKISIFQTEGGLRKIIRGTPNDQVSCQIHICWNWQPNCKGTGVY